MTFKDLRKAYSEYDVMDEDEDDRLESIRMYVVLAALLAVRLLTYTKYQSQREGSAKEEEDCRGYVQ